MYISKKDALTWFEFFSMLPEGEELLVWQQEIVYAVLSQIEEAVDARMDSLLKDIPGLKTIDNRSFYVGDGGKFPGGCLSCLCGTGLSAIRKTNRCNIECKFCYNYGELDQIPPVGEGMWEIGGTKYREADLEMLLSIQKKPTGVSYVYLEPFMEIEKYYGVVRIFKKAGIHQHLYTNGLLADEASLKALGEAGLDEIRFNLGASGCHDRVIGLMRTAKRNIPSVGIETPMTPEFFAAFTQKKQAILDTGIDFINCAELHLNPNNIQNYDGENMYMYRQGYISPTFSREISMKMMKMAAEEGWPIVVHDCSNRTKFARDLNLRAKEGGWFGASAYASEFPQLPYGCFLPVLRDENFKFLREEPLPQGYRPGDAVLF